MAPLSWAVFPFILGEEPALTPSNVRTLGASLGQLHSVTEPDWPEWARENPLSPRITVSVATMLRGETNPMIRRFVRLVDELVPQVTKAEHALPRGLVHGDIFPDNTLFDANGIRAVLDFEQVCHDAYLFDAAMALQGFCYVNERPELSLARPLIEGYESVRPLTDVERQATPLYMKWCALAMAGWHASRDHEYPNIRSQKRIDELLVRIMSEPMKLV